MGRVVLVGWFVMAITFAQDPEAGVDRLSSTERLLRIDSYRPLEPVATILAEDYQVHVNSEDPPFACRDDLVDEKPSERSPLAAEHFFLPKGGELNVRFSVDRHFRLVSVSELMERIVSEYNRRFPFKYRMQKDGDVYSLVPYEGRDKHCRSVRIEALLDHRISLPKGKTSIHEYLRAFEQELGRKAGEKVTVDTSAWVNRTIPVLPLDLEARDEAARDVLLTIIKATHYRFRWAASEQPVGQGWVISLRPLTGRVVKDSSGGGSTIHGFFGPVHYLHLLTFHASDSCEFLIVSPLVLDSIRTAG